MAHDSNADKINWTLIASSTSDSAATQKRLNHLIDEWKDEDRRLFGPSCSKAPECISNLKADALMFYHIYTDLVMLVKSEELQKSAYDMNKHYQELSCPQTLMDKSIKAFLSEKRLYGKETKINHRLHLKCQIVQEKFFLNKDEIDDKMLSPLLSTGKAMSLCLGSLTREEILESKNPEIFTILKMLKSNDDLCESIVDYLTTALPNMHQITL